MAISIYQNDIINDRHLGKKDLHLNTKGKGRLALNFPNKIWKF